MLIGSTPHFKLFSGRKSANPIACYEGSKFLEVNGRLKEIPAFLALEREAILIQDLVVLSFLVVENQVRERCE